MDSGTDSERVPGWLDVRGVPDGLADQDVVLGNPVRLLRFSIVRQWSAITPV
jgi:hypothetical protein